MKKKAVLLKCWITSKTAPRAVLIRNTFKAARRLHYFFGNLIIFNHESVIIFYTFRQGFVAAFYFFKFKSAYTPFQK